MESREKKQTPSANDKTSKSTRFTIVNGVKNESSSLRIDRNLSEVGG